MLSDSSQKSNTYRVVIPAGIEPPSGVAGVKLCTLLQYLMTLTCLSDERRYQGHYINVHSATWELLLSNGYRRVINDAVDAGYIQVNEKYSDGSQTLPFAKSMRLTRRYRTGKAQIVEISNRPAINRLAKSFEPDANNLGSTGLCWFEKLANFEIDPSATSDPELRDPWTQLVLAKLLDARHVAHRCDYRRLHTLFTQTAREARQYLSTTAGDPLAIIDVSACQPLIIGLLASNPPDNPTRPRQNTGRRPSLLPYVARFGRLPDIEKWIRLCELREIYEYLWNAVQNYNGDTMATITTRHGKRVTLDLRDVSLDSFKRPSLIPLFDRLPQMEANPVFRIIARDFPSIAEFVRTAKTKTYRIGKRTISHQVLACMAQRFEAETIIDDVGRYLMRYHPDEPVATIHDAILCRQSFATTGQQIIRDAFRRFGVSPNVNIDNL